MVKEYLVTKEPAMTPVHPGELLRDEILPGLKISVSDAARHLGVSRRTLHRIIVGTHSITPEMAVRIGKFCGNGPGLWLRMQQRYDLWHVERRLCKEIEKIPTHADK